MTRPAIFLDRDGTLNVEKGYLHRFEEWEWIPGALEAIRTINEMNYLAVVITNQAGIARGYYSANTVRELHRKVDYLLQLDGARIDAYYFCAHHPDFGTQRSCQCRKPEPGMLVQAQLDLDIDMARSWMIGDKYSDILAGQRAGVSPILVQTGYGKGESAHLDAGLPVATDVLSAVRKIQSLTRQNEHAGPI